MAAESMPSGVERGTAWLGMQMQVRTDALPAPAAGTTPNVHGVPLKTNAEGAGELASRAVD
jgi:hypothetical protein